MIMRCYCVGLCYVGKKWWSQIISIVCEINQYERKNKCLKFMGVRTYERIRKGYKDEKISATSLQ